MAQKKRFILELPYFLATQAGSIYVRIMFAACYCLLIASYMLPLVGTLMASAACLVFWQFFNIRTKTSNKYKHYKAFLLQRLVFCNVFILALFIYCTKEGVFELDLWYMCSFALVIVNLSDMFLTLKGFTGVAYINGKKNKN